MTKYDYGFKKQVVKAYLNGEGGYKFISKKYGIPDKSQVKKWVNAYKTLGDDGLKLKNKHTDYPIQFKLEVINYMATTKSSLQETANHFGMNNNSLIEAWKLKFLSGGSEALSRKSGRPSMGKNKSIKKKKLTREQELEHENEHEARIIHSLRSEFKLSIILEATKFPKSTYMYWQQRFGRENPDEELENKISEIFIKSNKTYGYRRITGEIRKGTTKVNSKKVRRIMNKLELKCVAFSHLQGYYITFKPVENFCIIVI